MQAPVILAALVSLCWLAASAVLLRRSHLARDAQQVAARALQTRLEVELFRASRRDGLTGLPSRSVFFETLSSAFARGGGFALLLIDLDEFSSVNARFGDAVGDELLCLFADRLRGVAGSRDHAARLDGDSFALLIEDSEDLKDLPATADRVLHSLTRICSVAGQLIDLGASIGVALAPEHGQTAEPLLRHARLARRQARDSGGNRWLACAPDIVRVALSRHQGREALVRAVSAGQIMPCYQPVVRLPSGELAKFEVLARWRHPTEGTLTPGRFIPLADEMGLSGRIGMALLQQAALDCRDWPEACRCAFNVSAGQMRELIDLLEAQPGEWQRRLDIGRMDVEMTEAALMHDRGLSSLLIDTLHAHGARAVLDDFGIGRANFALLCEMPFDGIKIGKPFVRTLVEDRRAEACVTAMLKLAENLGIDTVANGVETMETAACLTKLGCNQAQGPLYTRSFLKTLTES